MALTRRSILRNAALASVATTTGISSLLMIGCRRSNFASGIRVFFEGGWIFHADPFKGGYIRAVALDPSEFTHPELTAAQNSANVTMPPHHFPFGVWDEQSDWDSCHGNLPSNDPASGLNPLIAYPLEVFGTQNRAAKVPDLFLRADTDSRMTYLPNPANEFTFECRCKGLRVISLPMPTRIIPAGFRPDVEIQQSGASVLHPHCKTKDMHGFATTHILEYEGATSMTFNAPPNSGGQGSSTLTGGIGHEANFHFHAVPKDPCPAKGHDAIMFERLMAFVHLPLMYKLTLPPPPDKPAQIVPGSLVPRSVSNKELEIAPPGTQCKDGKPHIVNLATCGSGGGGAGGCPPGTTC